MDIERCHRAAEYSAQHRGVGLVIYSQGQLLHEDYPNGGDVDRLNALASGTKSFVGAMATAAAADGLISLDEPVARLLPEWEDDPVRSQITTRHLLQLVSGIAAGGKPGFVPDYSAALQTPHVAAPGERFFYCSAPFQIFGEALRRALQPFVEDPLVYLQTRLLDLLDITVRRWRRTRDGYPSLPTGAMMTTREWARFGELIRLEGTWQGKTLIPSQHLNECFVGSPDNPAYGLTWWLNVPLPTEGRQKLRQSHMGLEDLHSESALPGDLVYAAGAAKQRLYISRKGEFVIARQAAGVTEALAGGETSAFSDREFLRILLGENASRK